MISDLSVHAYSLQMKAKASHFRIFFSFHNGTAFSVALAHLFSLYFHVHVDLLGMRFSLAFHFTFPPTYFWDTHESEEILTSSFKKISALNFVFTLFFSLQGFYSSRISILFVTFNMKIPFLRFERARKKTRMCLSFFFCQACFHRLCRAVYLGT